MYQTVNYYQENNQQILSYKLKSQYLWDDHVSYTRNAIVSIIANLPDVDLISQRLLKNQEDIGDFIAPYYSAEQTNILVELLKKHITIAVDVIKGTAGAEEMWRSNGDDIVDHMNKMNRVFWAASTIGPMWAEHLDATIAQIDARKNKQWDQDISAYDMNHGCMSNFAEVFSSGVIYQNIEMFCLCVTKPGACNG